MLDRAHRLTEGPLFAETVRRGRRAGSATLVVHLRISGGDEPARVGLVVGKSVGNAVVRNQVKRRLRHLVREHLAELPDGGVLVIRALPAAAGASSPVLAADLVQSLARLTRSGERR